MTVIKIDMSLSHFKVCRIKGRVEINWSSRANLLGVLWNVLERVGHIVVPEHFVTSFAVDKECSKQFEWEVNGAYVVIPMLDISAAKIRTFTGSWQADGEVSLIMNQS